MSAALSLALAASAQLLGAQPVAANAWPALERAGALLEALPDAPILSFVRGGPHPRPLLDEELAASLEALRVAAAALAPLDEGLAAGRCVLPPNARLGSMRSLGEWVLALAVADARVGRHKLAAISVGRAADLSAALVRCAGASPASHAIALAIGSTARHVTFALADDGALPVDGVARIAAALRWSTELLTTAELAPALRDARADQALLEEAAAALLAHQRSGAWPSKLPIEDHRLAHGERWFALAPVQRAAVELRCSPGLTAGTFTMTREAAAALSRRGPDAILQGSIVTPQLDGRAGLLVARAGAVARSCGLADGDLVLEVNGVLLQRPEDALIAAPAQVQRDQRAAFRVRRDGEEQLIRVEPDRPL